MSMKLVRCPPVGLNAQSMDINERKKNNGVYKIFGRKKKKKGAAKRVTEGG